MATSEGNLRIKSIKVTGLFGLYSHHVTLKDDRVTPMATQTPPPLATSKSPTLTSP